MLSNNKKLRKVILISIFVFIPVLVYSDLFTPFHYCHKPFKPFSFTSEWQIKQYKNDVQQYKNCIIDFANEQLDAARKHLEARAVKISGRNGNLL